MADLFYFCCHGILGNLELTSQLRSYDELIVDMLVRIRKEDDVLFASCGFQGIDAVSTSVLRRVSTLQAVQSPVSSERNLCTLRGANPDN